ncbi:FAD-dependent oxidoreductase [Thermodesulfobacteriota bacterium]
MRPRYEDKTAPCSSACPVGEDIAQVEMLVTQQRYMEAAKTILEENPFPAICGRVCYHPCEDVCNRAEFDQSIAIHNLERVVGDTLISNGKNLSIEKLPDNGKKIAILGAGPAGLSAAYFLSRLGFGCDIFEAQSEPGGLLRWGIPAYRLPGEILKSEIKRIENMGVKIHCGKAISKNYLDDFGHRYDAVFIGCGHGQSIQLKIPGEKVAGEGLALLRKIRKGEVDALRGVVAVIGGGNAAIDVSRSLVRLGAKPILVYRRRRQDMPAFKEEIAMALDEGIELRELVAPTQIEGINGEILLTLQKMRISEMNAQGRARVVPDEGETETMRVQKIITAIGAEAEAHWHIPGPKERKRLNLGACTLVAEKLPVIFGGDLTNPAKSITNAIASGKQAAIALDVFFQEGWDAIEQKLGDCRIANGPSLSMEIYLKGNRRNRSSHVVSFSDINSDYFQSNSRVLPPLIAMAKRVKSFMEVEQTFTAETALEEAARCFNCGLCNNCDNCMIFCPEVAVVIEEMRRINLDYCKGCGICVVECPRNAMALEEEEV